MKTVQPNLLSICFGGLFALVLVLGGLGCAETPTRTDDGNGIPESAETVPLNVRVQFPEDAGTWRTWPPTGGPSESDFEDGGSGGEGSGLLMPNDSLPDLPLFARGGFLSLDSVRTYVFEPGTGGEALRARAAVPVSPEDEQFSISLRVPLADEYAVVVQAIGQDGPEDNRTEQGILFHGVARLTDLQSGSNPPVEVSLQRVAPRPRRQIVDGEMELVWDNVADASYQLEIEDTDGSRELLDLSAARFLLEGRVGRVPSVGTWPDDADTVLGRGEEPPHRVFRVRSMLPRGYRSAFSETLRVRVRLPAPIEDLAATVITTSTATLEWTATGDDGHFGQATAYDLRRSTSPITDDTSFEAATILTDAPTPASSGSPETYQASGLESGMDYYFAIKAIDEVGNASALSNILLVTTPVPTPGACCLDAGACTLVAIDVCDKAGGNFEGAGTSCDPNPCPQLGACCFPNGSCLVLVSSECESQGGIWTIDPAVCDPNPCPQPTAACCFVDGSCEVLTEAECTAADGDWEVVVTACDPNPCIQPTRACCFVDGSCVTSTEAQCVADGATWQPGTETCDPNPCPLPIRVCCFADGSCSLLDEPACLGADGVWRPGDDTCSPNPCPVPTAVCCFANGSCNILTEANCLSVEGTWESDLSACLPNPCPEPVAVCCIETSCTITTESECLASEGTWLSGQGSCDPNPCDPLAACCFSDGSCSLQTQSDCVSSAGEWDPSNLSCDPSPCPQPFPCCFADGACTMLLELDCLAEDGTPQLESSICDPNPCPQPTAACCFADGSCQVLEAIDCSGSEGVWMAESDSCDPNPCPQPTAACCFSDLSCQVLTEPECSSAEGIWLSETPLCSPDPCAVAPGACCLATGTCIVQPEAECTEGVFQGPFTSCSPNPCPLFPDLTLVETEFDPLEPGCGAAAIRVRVRNQGAATAAASTIRVRLNGEVVCSIDTPALNPNITVWTEFCDLGSLAEGSVTVEACADDDDELLEADEANNCAVIPLSIPACPDLVIDSIEFDPDPPACGSPVRVRAIVRNAGGTASGAFMTRFTLAGETACTETSTSLAVGASAPTPWCDLGLPTDVTLDVEACADADNEIGEANEDNNCRQRVVSVPPCVGWWDGFGPVPGNGTNGAVIALFEHDGLVYAGGMFDQAGGVAVNNIAVWDGARWTALGSGTDGPVWTIGEFNGLIVVGGQFETAGGLSANGIAAWTGSSWITLGSGVFGYVLDTEVYQGELYAGGYFPEFGSIAKWTGTFWSAVDSGVYLDSGQGLVYALETLNNRLYVGGRFQYAGGPGLGAAGEGAISALNVASWTSAGSWESLASGIGTVEDAVFTLESYSGLLYAGGTFQFAGPTFVGRIAAWTGTSWVGLPGSQVGTDDWVLALQPFNGSLAVAGRFSSAGGVTAPRIARWTGSTWQAFDEGISGGESSGGPLVYRMTVQGSHLYAGGIFTSAGGLPSLNIARWDE